MTPERAGPLIHVKALRGSNAYAYFWLSEGLRSQAAMTEPSFLPAPVLAVCYSMAERLRRCAGSGTKSAPRSGSRKPTPTPDRFATEFSWNFSANILVRHGCYSPRLGERSLETNATLWTLNQRVQGSSPCAPTIHSVICGDFPTVDNNPGLAGFRTRESSSFGVAVSVASSLSMRPIFQRLSSRSFQDLCSNLAIQ